MKEYLVLAVVLGVIIGALAMRAYQHRIEFPERASVPATLANEQTAFVDPLGRRVQYSRGMCSTITLYEKGGYVWQRECIVAAGRNGLLSDVRTSPASAEQTHFYRQLF